MSILPIILDRSLTDPNLMGAALGDPRTWLRWLATLRAAFALRMSAADLAAFAEVAGNRQPPRQRVRELWCCVGRRSGKSRIAAALAIYAACFTPQRLAAGETGTVLVLAASTSQARTVFDYCVGFLEASPILKLEVASTTAHEIRLHNGAVISVHANSYRTVRGKTLLACIFDEVAFWRDDTSALPDVETYRAVLPSLVTTRGMLIGISSPYRKIGLLFQKFRDSFAQGDPDVLVVQGASRLFNPTLDESVIAAACASDPEAARAEWDADFRSDISQFLDDETIEAAIDPSRPIELPPLPRTYYKGFVDPSGGRHNSFTIAIGHKNGGNFVADVIRGRKPPFDPQSVVAEYADLLRQYRITTVTGDNYSAEWCLTSFREAGITYQRSDKNKSELYLEALPLFMRSASLNISALYENFVFWRDGLHVRAATSWTTEETEATTNALAGMLRAAQGGGWDSSFSWV